MITQGTETRQGQDPQGLGAKHDGPFGAADAPQPTDNAEPIMTDVQQAGAIDIEPRDHAIPDGMKLWQGGEDAPADWDGGPVWFRAGRLSGKGEGPKAGPDGKWIEGWGNWHHLNGWDSANKAAVPGKMDVIAYTPTSTSEQQAVPVAQELREVMPGHWSTSGGLAMALATLDDPHMARSRERISDFALANEVYLSPGIANLTDAKERIRWLSASLAVALLPASLPCKSGEGAGDVGDFVMVPRKLTDDMHEAVVKLDFTSTHDPLWPEYWAAMLDAAPPIYDATQTREAEEPTEAMMSAGYDATRIADGTPQFADAGFCLGHARDIYIAMRAALNARDAA